MTIKSRLFPFQQPPTQDIGDFQKSPLFLPTKIPQIRHLVVENFLLSCLSITRQFTRSVALGICDLVCFNPPPLVCKETLFIPRPLIPGVVELRVWVGVFLDLITP